VLDLGWSEMAIIATVALFVIGPKTCLRRFGLQVGMVAR